LSIIHQVHFLGTIYPEITGKEKLPNFNPNEGEVIDDNFRKNLFLEKFNYVEIFYDELDKKKSSTSDRSIYEGVDGFPADKLESFKPSNILKKMDEFVRKVAIDLNLPEWRLQSFLGIKNKMKNLSSLKKVLVKAKPDEPSAKPDTTKEVVKTKLTPQSYTAEELKEIKEMLENVESDEKEGLQRLIDKNRPFKVIKEYYKSIRAKTIKLEEKALSEYEREINVLKTLAQSYAFKNNQISIWNKMNEEILKRKVKDFNLDDLDKVVNDVFKEVERIYNGLSEKQKSDIVLSNTFKRNEKERTDLLTKINYARSILKR
jgi:hypothetical protein